MCRQDLSDGPAQSESDEYLLSCSFCSARVSRAHLKHHLREKHASIIQETYEKTLETTRISNDTVLNEMEKYVLDCNRMPQHSRKPKKAPDWTSSRSVSRAASSANSNGIRTCASSAGQSARNALLELPSGSDHRRHAARSSAENFDLSDDDNEDSLLCAFCTSQVTLPQLKQHLLTDHRRIIREAHEMADQSEGQALKKLTLNVIEFNQSLRPSRRAVTQSQLDSLSASNAPSNADSSRNLPMLGKRKNHGDFGMTSANQSTVSTVAASEEPGFDRRYLGSYAANSDVPSSSSRFSGAHANQDFFGTSRRKCGFPPISDDGLGESIASADATSCFRRRISNLNVNSGRNEASQSGALLSHPSNWEEVHLRPTRFPPTQQPGTSTTTAASSRQSRKRRHNFDSRSCI